MALVLYRYVRRTPRVVVVNESCPRRKPRWRDHTFRSRSVSWKAVVDAAPLAADVDVCDDSAAIVELIMRVVETRCMSSASELV